MFKVTELPCLLVLGFIDYTVGPLSNDANNFILIHLFLIIYLININMEQEVFHDAHEEHQIINLAELEESKDPAPPIIETFDIEVARKLKE